MEFPVLTSCGKLNFIHISAAQHSHTLITVMLEVSLCHKNKVFIHKLIPFHSSFLSAASKILKCWNLLAKV